MAPEAKKIKDIACNAYHVDMKELLVARRGVTNEARNVAIYLIRCLTGESLERIGQEFNMTKYSSVSSIIGQMKTQIPKDKQLRNRVEKLERKVKVSQEQT